MTDKPTRYELIAKNGKVHSEWAYAKNARDYAKSAWPDQEQDPNRTGRGWHVREAIELHRAADVRRG